MAGDERILQKRNVILIIVKEYINTCLDPNSLEKMKAISKAYITKRECSVQEAAYDIMPELWSRKTFPRTS